MKKKMVLSSLLAALLVTLAVTEIYLKKDIKETKGVEVVPTMQDDITSDSSWCPTFQLIFNDLKNDLELLKEYSPIFHFFKGVNGIKHNDDDIKDSVLIYQKKKDN